METIDKQLSLKVREIRLFEFQRPAKYEISVIKWLKKLLRVHDECLGARRR